MEAITRYKCEICGKEYLSSDAALECEGKGEFDVNKFPSIGTMYEYHHNGYVGIFSIARIEVNKSNGKHFGSSSNWAARVEGYPLGVGYENENMCGGYDFHYSNDEYISRWIKRNHITENKVNTPEFKRMVKYLKSIKVTPKYYTPKGRLITLK